MIRRLLNPKASSTNTLKLFKSQSGCCGDGIEVCKYTFDNGSTAIVVRGLKIQEKDGTEVATLLADIPGGADMITAYGALNTDAERVKYLQRTIFPALFEAAGYLIQSKSDIQISSDLYTIVFIGEADVTAIVTSTTDVTVDEVACKKIAICDYSANFEGTQTGGFDVTIGDTDYAIAPAEGGWTYPGDLSVIQSELDSELGAAVLGVTVVDDTVNESFKITITEPVGTNVVIAGNVAQCCNVRGDFEDA